MVWGRVLAASCICLPQGDHLCRQSPCQYSTPPPALARQQHTPTPRQCPCARLCWERDRYVDGPELCVLPSPISGQDGSCFPITLPFLMGSPFPTLSTCQSVQLPPPSKPAFEPAVPFPWGHTAMSLPSAVVGSPGFE